jgi:hypothetical protein
MALVRIRCDGLNPNEGKELQTRLVRLPGVLLVELENIHQDPVFTRDSVQAAAPHITLILKLAEVGVGALATGALTEAGKDLYKQVGVDAVDALGRWLKGKFQGKTGVPIQVSLYGPDGELLRTFDRKR